LAFALALTCSGVGLGAPPGQAQERDFLLVAEPGGYNGSAPGPLLDVVVGDVLVVTLVNEMARPVSFHTHGMALAEAMDGVPAHSGTQMVDSTAPPGGSFTYRLRAPYPGVWNYHDHALGTDASEADGFYGTIVVRAAGEERPATAIDVHLVDGSCPILPSTARAPFELDVTALGNDIWTFNATGGAAATLGPAISARFTGPTPGAYAWSATSRYFGASCGGTVVAS
jgi:FtsP/CotA-like multicopper oxidase with cupredoxin domain